VVGVHGIGQQIKGEDVLRGEWLPPMRSGLRRLGSCGALALDRLASEELFCAFYGDLFRPLGSLGVSDPWLTAQDATEYDAELLLEWWRTAAQTDPAVPNPDADLLMRVPATVQAALRALSHSKFFAGVASRALLFDLAQVRRYFVEPEIRARIASRVEASITPDTRVLVGHSLGSIIAYETLCAHPDWPATSLITLGSPLGIRNLIFDRLTPRPNRNVTPPGHWPPCLQSWTNIADRGDAVALVKELSPLFGSPRGATVSDIPVHNGSHAHDVSPYLTAESTGRALAEAIAGSVARP
jgi:hypothetical protein